MVNRKGKTTTTTKAVKKRDGVTSQAEDVPVQTALPPQVEGQLRCFLCLSVSRISWLTSKSPDVTLVSVLWWGEKGSGTVFRPVDIKKNNKTTSKTVARYPVRSGPKQFASYLNDMGSLTVEVLSEPDMVSLGHAEISQLSTLAPGHAVKGEYPVFSQNGKKIANLHVSLNLESLMESYDSTGSIPTTDLSNAIQHQESHPHQMQPIPHKQPEKLISPNEIFLSPNQQPSKDNGRQASFTVPSATEQTFKYKETISQAPGVTGGGTVSITTSGNIVRTDPVPDWQERSGANYSSGLYSEDVGCMPSEQTTDLVSVLLDKGKKLREAMVLSSVSEQKSDKTKPMDVNMSNSSLVEDTPSITRSSSTGSLFRELLQADRSGQCLEEADAENRAVDLVVEPVIGVEDFQGLRTLAGSPKSSVSSLENAESDLSDPLHDVNILEELFYKNQDGNDSSFIENSGNEKVRAKRSNSQSSIDEPGNMRPPSRKSSLSSCSYNLVSAETGKKKKSEKSLAKKKLKKPKKLRKVKKKGKKTRRKSDSETSDTDSTTTSQSESSRVSFDMVPSDIESKQIAKASEKVVDGLSVERLTLLGRVHIARVAIDSLTFQGAQAVMDRAKKVDKSCPGRPPKPKPIINKSTTYFIEYQFPVVAAARDKYFPNTMATEVMRVVSKEIKDNSILFNHHSVFPVMFDGNSIESWWKSALVFRLYTKVPGQKTPSLVGSCGISLKSILKAKSLFLERKLEVVGSSKKTSATAAARNRCWSPRKPDAGQLGILKITVELASDSKDFPSAMARTELAERSGKTTLVPIIPQPTQKQSSKCTAVDLQLSQIKGQKVCSETQTESGNIDIGELISSYTQVMSQQVQPTNLVYQVPLSYQNNMESGLEPMTLHTLLMIPVGKNITLHGTPPVNLASKKPQPPPACFASSAQGSVSQNVITRNTYLLCRMFWCDEMVRSNVCWRTCEPQFDFVQVAPLLVTASLLERMRNNFLVIEVWDKKTSAENDMLVGIVKLSLHQFYLSLKNKRIASALFKAQYPIVANDAYLPVVNPLSGYQFGQLKVLLAIGLAEQISALQRLMFEGSSSTAIPERPPHHLLRPDSGVEFNDRKKLGHEQAVEHIFEVVVEGIHSMQMFKKMVWGESDCFVQYHFPTQMEESRLPRLGGARQATTLKSFRTATTLCIPDPTFNGVTRHRLVLHPKCPVQKELLSACTGVGGGVGGILFEVWCRYYHPNVRDQVMAKAILPLAKLCAMVTMRKKGELSVQSFSLPLTLVPLNKYNPEEKAKLLDSGLLDVTVNYKSQIIQDSTSVVTAAGRCLSSAHVCLSVALKQACGLKTAAQVLSHFNKSLQYPAEVGVNAYAKVQLSFLAKENERVTHTIARSFAPEFSHFLEFPCPLRWTDSADDETVSLAELLETAELLIEVWHQTSSRVQVGMQENEKYGGSLSKMQDTLLCTAVIPLGDLLTHTTGINGWFPLHKPTQDCQAEVNDHSFSGRDGLEKVVGGIEINARFSHSSEREQVIHAAKAIGWQPLRPHFDLEDWESDDDHGDRLVQITFDIDHVCFPLHSCKSTGQDQLTFSGFCYVRYKFYDKGSVVSKLQPLKCSDSDYTTVKCHHTHKLNVEFSMLLQWYMREETLEIQVWVTHGTTRIQDWPRHRDKLIGSGYVPLYDLCDWHRKQHRISGIYPLYKPGVASMDGAYLRSHISLSLLQHNQDLINKDVGVRQEQNLSAEELTDEEHDLTDEHLRRNHKTGQEILEFSGKTFSVHMFIDQAMHLPHVKNQNSNELCHPCTYVSYQTARKTKLSYTPVVPDTDCPVWEWECEAELSAELLHQETKNLVLKVWHKPPDASQEPDKSSDKVLGFVSVDLSPLASGLQQLCGWYNIMDFRGQCQGQIKISVTPMNSVAQYKRSSLQSVECLDSSDICFSHFQEHYKNVKWHHENLKRQQEQESLISNRIQPSSHWKPQLPSFHVDESSSRSQLFSTLKRQMQELDIINSQLKSKLDAAPVEAFHPSHLKNVAVAPPSKNVLSLEPVSESIYEPSLLRTNFDEQEFEVFDHVSSDHKNFSCKMASAKLGPDMDGLHGQGYLTEQLMQTSNCNDKQKSEKKDDAERHYGLPPRSAYQHQAEQELNNNAGYGDEQQVDDGGFNEEQSLEHGFETDCDSEAEIGDQDIIIPRLLNNVSGSFPKAEQTQSMANGCIDPQSLCQEKQPINKSPETKDNDFFTRGVCDQTLLLNENVKLQYSSSSSDSGEEFLDLRSISKTDAAAIRGFIENNGCSRNLQAKNDSVYNWLQTQNWDSGEQDSKVSHKESSLVEINHSITDQQRDNNYVHCCNDDIVDQVQQPPRDHPGKTADDGREDEGKSITRNQHQVEATAAQSAPVALTDKPPIDKTATGCPESCAHIDQEVSAGLNDKLDTQQVGCATKKIDAGSPRQLILPSFFLPLNDLEKSMRALQSVTRVLPRPNTQNQQERDGSNEALEDFNDKPAPLGTDAAKRIKMISVKGKPRPTVEETKRIARIFSMKFT